MHVCRCKIRLQAKVPKTIVITHSNMAVSVDINVNLRNSCHGLENMLLKNEKHTYRALFACVFTEITMTGISINSFRKALFIAINK